MTRDKKILIAILLLAALLRFYGLGRGDTVNDEVFMSFRGLGMIDFDEGDYQTTPWQWFDPLAWRDCEGEIPNEIPQYCLDNPAVKHALEKGETFITGIPWWARLSFHDHPLLVPFAQNLSLSVFGTSTAAARLPSAVLGVASVWLLFLLGKKIFSEEAGLMGTFIYAVTLNGIFISRVGMQESFVIFFLLLVFNLFLEGLRRKKYFLWAGAALGLGMLAKYTVVVAAPIMLSYLLFRRRDVFRHREFWASAGIAFLLFSPIIVYNYELLKAVGHFDFQLSHIFNQPHPEWPVQPGKEIGSLSERLLGFTPRLIHSNSWIFLIVFIFSLAAFARLLFLKPRETWNKFGFIFLATIWLLLLFAKIGTAYRFLTMLAPFLALAGGLFLAEVFARFKDGKRKILAVILLAFLAMFEIFYSWNNQISFYPLGPSPWLSSRLRYENYNWGYNALDDYLEKEFAGQIPLLTFDVQYDFLEKLRQEALANGTKRRLKRVPFLIIYGGNFDDGAKLWVMERRLVYQAWPVLKVNTFFQYREEQGEDYFDRAGFSRQYFIITSNYVPEPEFARILKGIEPLIIRNARGDEVFYVHVREAEKTPALK